MKRLLAVLLSLAMLLSLAACGGSAEGDPNAGKYIGISAAVGGFAMPMSDVYPGETWIELKSGGKGSIMLDGEDFSFKWTLDGECLTITVQGVDSIGTLSGGDIVIDLMDMGCVMTFRKEGTEPAENEAPAASYNDAGYWELIRIDSVEEGSSVSEEDMLLLKRAGMTMYLELLEDGSGVLFMEEEMPVTWQDGTIKFTEDNMTINYMLENDLMTLDMIESKLVFRKGFQPLPSEMEQAGFTEFMELGVAYPYTTLCHEYEGCNTTGEATITSYEIFESAEGYEYKEGYEWRVAKAEVRFTDKMARNYGMRARIRIEDYYNVALLDDYNVYDEEADLTTYKLIHQGKQMEGYYRTHTEYSDWHRDANGVKQCIFSAQWAFHVPVGYDGCVAGFADASRAPEEDYYITDLEPDVFLFFRLDERVSPKTTADDGSLAGDYSLYALEDSGEYIDNATLISLGMDGAVVITFNDDGTGIMSTEGEAVAFTYDATKISDADGFTYEYVLEDGMLKVDVGNGQIFHCRKQ